MPSPLVVTANCDPLAIYLRDSSALIGTRATQLFEATVSARPAWLASLGTPPEDPGRRTAWDASITVVAAYRDQHRVTTNDPRHPLGPHPDPAHSSYYAYLCATEAVRAARHPSDSGLGQSETLHADTPTSAASRLSREPQRFDRGRALGSENPQQNRQALLPPRHAPYYQQGNRPVASPRL